MEEGPKFHPNLDYFSNRLYPDEVANLTRAQRAASKIN